MAKAVNILLVEDNPGDIRLIKEAMKFTKLNHNLLVVTNGMAAIDFLMKEGKYKDAVTPDLILLDLNLPRLSGKEVLNFIKKHDKLRLIPVVILTISEARRDILETYKAYANAYITKPIDMDHFIDVIKKIESFWFRAAKMPSHAD